MNLEFRPLEPEEIDARVALVNKGGVRILLYKDARCDQNILDQTVGPLGWQRHHSRENANCTVSIWDADKKQWVEKEDTGVESNTEKEKGLASDSFKRACFNWGIGRELYTAPDIFIPKEKLRHYAEKDGKPSCYDTFKVMDISYVPGKKVIAGVKIALTEYGKVYDTLTFINRDVVESKAEKPEEKAEKPAEKAEKSASKSSAKSSVINDDTVILIGNCRGKRYGDVKDTKEFRSFLEWVKTAGNAYDDEPRKQQFPLLKALATSPEEG